jgi:hypothetical protein
MVLCFDTNQRFFFKVQALAQAKLVPNVHSPIGES